MNGVQCTKCGFISYRQQLKCKRCNTPLGDFVPAYAAQVAAQEHKEKLVDNVRLLSLFGLIAAIAIASVVVALTVYNLLPPGRYSLAVILVPTFIIDACVFAGVMYFADEIEDWYLQKKGF